FGDRLFIGFDLLRRRRLIRAAGAESNWIRHRRLAVFAAKIVEARAVDAQPVIGVGLERHRPHKRLFILPARLADQLRKNAETGIDQRSSAGTHGLVENAPQFSAGRIDVLRAIFWNGFHDLWRGRDAKKNEAENKW